MQFEFGLSHKIQKYPSLIILLAMNITKKIKGLVHICNYTPDIYAKGYIVFVFPFVRSLVLPIRQSFG